tara:strand:- start:599 stop:877 length:279 start_codon:yes stop_codon:yes gene_type:complete
VFELVKPCQNCKSYILKPKNKVNLNLGEIVKKIESFSYEILAFTGSMLSLKKKCKINIYASGKIAIMTKDLNQVQKLTVDLEKVLDVKKNNR